MCITKNVFQARGEGGGTFQPLVLSDLLRTTSEGGEDHSGVTLFRHPSTVSEHLPNSTTSTSTATTARAVFTSAVAAGTTLDNAAGTHTTQTVKHYFCDRKTAQPQTSSQHVPITVSSGTASAKTVKGIGIAIEGSVGGNRDRTFPAQEATTTRGDTPLAKWNDRDPKNHDKSSPFPSPFLALVQTRERQRTLQQPKGEEESTSTRDLSFLGVKQLSGSAGDVIDTDLYLAKRRRKKKVQLPGKTAKQQDRHFVRHSYHDHATEHALWLSSVTQSGGINPNANVSGVTPSLPRKNRGGVSMSFPYKLHEMLDGRGVVRFATFSRNEEEEIERDELLGVVSWQPHGRAFKIHDPKTFTEKIMPRYFRQTKLTSFQRQLNLYGFLRLSRQGPDEGAYYHELFLRGMPQLCARMVRTKCKGTGFKASSSPDSEPDFYSMPPVPVPALPVPPLPTPRETSSVATAHKRGADDGYKEAEDENVKNCNKWAVRGTQVPPLPSLLPFQRQATAAVPINQPPQAVTPRAIINALSRISSSSESSSLTTFGHDPNPCDLVRAGIASQLPPPPPAVVTIPGPTARQHGQHSLSQPLTQVHHRNWSPRQAEEVVTASEDEEEEGFTMDRQCHADPFVSPPIKPPQLTPSSSLGAAGRSSHQRIAAAHMASIGGCRPPEKEDGGTRTTADPLDEFITAFCSNFPSASAAVGDRDVDFVMETEVESDEQLGCLLDEVAREVDAGI